MAILTTLIGYSLIYNSCNVLTISDFKDSVKSACPLIELIVLFYYLLFM